MSPFEESVGNNDEFGLDVALAFPEGVSVVSPVEEPVGNGVDGDVELVGCGDELAGVGIFMGASDDPASVGTSVVTFTVGPGVKFGLRVALALPEGVSVVPPLEESVGNGVDGDVELVGCGDELAGVASIVGASDEPASVGTSVVLFTVGPGVEVGLGVALAFPEGFSVVSPVEESVGNGVDTDVGPVGCGDELAGVGTSVGRSDEPATVGTSVAPVAVGPGVELGPGGARFSVVSPVEESVGNAVNVAVGPSLGRDDGHSSDRGATLPSHSNSGGSAASRLCSHTSAWIQACTADTRAYTPGSVSWAQATPCEDALAERLAQLQGRASTQANWQNNLSHPGAQPHDGVVAARGIVPLQDQRSPRVALARIPPLAQAAQHGVADSVAIADEMTADGSRPLAALIVGDVVHPRTQQLVAHDQLRSRVGVAPAQRRQRALSGHGRVKIQPSRRRRVRLRGPLQQVCRDVVLHRIGIIIGVDKHRRSRQHLPPRSPLREPGVPDEDRDAADAHGAGAVRGREYQIPGDEDAPAEETQPVEKGDRVGMSAGIGLLAADDALNRVDGVGVRRGSVVDDAAGAATRPPERKGPPPRGIAMAPPSMDVVRACERIRRRGAARRAGMERRQHEEGGPDGGNRDHDPGLLQQVQA